MIYSWQSLTAAKVFSLSPVTSGGIPSARAGEDGDDALARYFRLRVLDLIKSSLSRRCSQSSRFAGHWRRNLAAQAMPEWKVGYNCNSYKQRNTGVPVDDDKRHRDWRPLGAPTWVTFYFFYTTLRFRNVSWMSFVAAWYEMTKTINKSNWETKMQKWNHMRPS